MVFSSITFLFYFLPMVLAVYYVSPKKVKNVVLLVASMLFYFYGEPKYVILMALTILLTYVFGLLIDKYPKHKHTFLILSIIIQIGLLIYFKYINFLIQNINTIFSAKIDLVNVVLPIGISFYTFQAVSYVVDVYRGEVPVQKNFLNLASYVALFPQLIAGPIVRYKDIESQLSERKHCIKNISLGIRRFVIGLGKKVLIANVLGELVNIAASGNETSVLYYWMYGLANMLQIYFDFSGYSDMAIGLGKMFGFEFPENFNYPYISTCVTEFWRRWHMSLGTWFRDYVYIPLGGNRTSKIKHIRNIFVVWMLTGLWHGAAWNFIIWGVYFGIILIIEKYCIFKHPKPKANGNDSKIISHPTSKANSNESKIIPQPKSKTYGNESKIILHGIRIILTNFIVMISFIIFSGESTKQIFDNIKGLFGIGGIPFVSVESIYYLRSYAIILITAIVGATPIMKKLCTANSKVEKVTELLEPIFILLVFVVSTCYIIDGSFNPFLYFRF